MMTYFTMLGTFLVRPYMPFDSQQAEERDETNTYDSTRNFYPLISYCTKCCGRKYLKRGAPVGFILETIAPQHKQNGRHMEFINKMEQRHGLCIRRLQPDEAWTRSVPTKQRQKTFPGIIRTLSLENLSISPQSLSTHRCEGSGRESQT